jgi:hypothetical protein
MTPQHWQQIEQIYHAALERKPAQRAAFLQRACAGDPNEQKRLVIFEAGHIIPRNQLIKETLDWLDRYLGPVKRKES